MFYLIDKPLGCTSFDVLRKLRKILGIKKIGHTGTLDPLASGCLLVATENSTKLIPMLENAKKRYRTTIRIDGMSETLDTGSVITQLENYKELVNTDRTKAGLESFLLEQKQQIPPKYSALKVAGERAYSLARDGKEFELAARDITIYEVRIHALELPYIDLEVLVSSGTYIRSLAPTIGEYFGTNAGYLTTLERIEIITPDAVSLKKEQAQGIDKDGQIKNISYESLFPAFGRIDLSREEYEDIILGKEIDVTTLDNRHIYFIYYSNKIVSLGSIDNSRLKVIRNGI